MATSTRKYPFNNPSTQKLGAATYAARTAAKNRLVELHADEFEALVADEMRHRGYTQQIVQTTKWVSNGV